MLEIERIAQLETKVSALSGNITDLSTDIKDVGQDVLAIKLLLAQQSGGRRVLNWTGHFVAGITGAVVGLYGAAMGIHK